MPEPEAQSYASHRRYDPLYHFVLFGILVVNLLVRGYFLYRNPGLRPAWEIVMAIALVILALKARTFPLRAQDRVIRLEERLRLQTLLAEPLRARIPELREGQLIALRFAPDAELPGLVEQALAERLGGEEIKKRIKVWRPDNFRV
jgi:hypothetical protein